MTSHTTKRFRQALRRLPAAVRSQARAAYRLFRADPYYPSLQFKRIHPTLPIFSARVGLDYRAVAQKEGDEVIWFWIGSHSDYDKLIAQLR